MPDLRNGPPGTRTPDPLIKSSLAARTYPTTICTLSDANTASPRAIPAARSPPARERASPSARQHTPRLQAVCKQDVSGSVECVSKLLDRQACQPDQLTQGSRCEFAVIWDRQRYDGADLGEYHVTAGLATEDPASSLEGRAGLPTADDRKIRQRRRRSRPSERSTEGPAPPAPPGMPRWLL